VGGEAGGRGDTYNCAGEVIGLELDVLGKEVNFRVDVGQGRARLADIVPLARTLCTKITDVVVESILSDGGNIPCCKGCAACCARYLVAEAGLVPQKWLRCRCKYQMPLLNWPTSLRVRAPRQ